MPQHKDVVQPPRHLIDLRGCEPDWIRAMFLDADIVRMGAARPGAGAPRPQRTAALLLDTSTLRECLSFGAALRALGYSTVDIDAQALADATPEYLDQYGQMIAGVCDLAIARTASHPTVRRFANATAIPVINAGTDFSHPAHVLNDLYTLHRNGRDIAKMRVAWVGAGTSVLHSWLEAAALFGFELRIAVPDGHEPDAGLFLDAERLTFGRVARVRHPREAIDGADVVYTQPWTDDVRDPEARNLAAAFAGYAVTPALFALARRHAVFLHGHAAARGPEVAQEIFHGPRSLVHAQEENALFFYQALAISMIERTSICPALHGRMAEHPA